MDLLLSIPGIWNHEDQIYEVPKKHPQYFFRKEQQIVEMLVKPHDENLVSDFRFLLPEDIPEKEFERLDTHTHNVFVAGAVNNHDELMNMIQAAAEIVKTGGMAVRVESSKTAVTAAEWLLLLKDAKKANLFKTFVGFLKDGSYVQSYGMQILGKPDARIAAGENTSYTYNLLRNFLFKAYFEDIAFNDQQLVALYENEPEYMLRFKSDERDTNNLFYNEYGIWELVKQQQHA